MVSQIILNLVGGFTAGLILVLGVIILTGSWLTSVVPENSRILIGVIFVIYGTYRLIMIWLRQRRLKRYEE